MRCHLLLTALESFATSPDNVSLLTSAATQAVQAISFGLLSPHFMSSFAFVNSQTRVASSSGVHIELALSFLPLVLVFFSIGEYV
jgi:hypothetical protein